MDKKKVLTIICVACIIFIFFNSSQEYSASNVRSMNIVVAISKTRIGQFILSHISIQNLDLIVRKVAHVFEFFLLGIILCNVLDYLKIEDKNIIIYSLFIILFIATLDEFFQLFIEDRTSSVKDVLIDFSGGIIANILYFIFSMPRGRHIERKQYGFIRSKKS